METWIKVNFYIFSIKKNENRKNKKKDTKIWIWSFSSTVTYIIKVFLVHFELCNLLPSENISAKLVQVPYSSEK